MCVCECECVCVCGGGVFCIYNRREHIENSQLNIIRACVHTPEQLLLTK